MITAVVAHAPIAAAAGYTLVGWNNLGMHCMDADYAVFSLLPPYNTIYAQLIDPQGHLVHDASGITVTYEAVADPDGSVNRTSAGKTNFWDNVDALFGVSLPLDAGLAGKGMPGAANQPQPMSFDSAASWFVAEGIPVTPYDDAAHKNPYPLMRLVARDGNGVLLAATDIVLPVSDEMNCASCHASGSSAAAQPFEGWVNDPEPQRDMRLNILRLHDERDGFSDAYKNALAAAGYNAAGLFATVTADGKSVLCARCHFSEALPGSGLPGIEPLTQAVHRRMAFVYDPVTGMALGAVDNRSGCYRCHPGATTRCLRGVMGNAVATDGSRAIQCQSCHGSMLDVGAPTRTGWLDEPACQSCHTGTAVHNNGALRYTTAFDTNGQPRVAVDSTFATNPDTPSPGKSLYRFSTGHGGLKCEACHGSTHAEFPSSHLNDNLQSIAVQGHAGTLAECASCHGSVPNTVTGGPHGMHPVGQTWVDQHPNVVGDDGGTGPGPCRLCHGADYRGTALSRVQAERTLNAGDFGTKVFWRGFQVGCYTCHNGPGGGEGQASNRPAVVTNSAASTSQETPVQIPLHATDPDGNPLTLRIVSQPSGGTVGLTGMTAKYFPEPGFSGGDSFTFAAWDGSTDSNLGVVTLSVSGLPAPTATSSTTATPTATHGTTASPTPDATPTSAPVATATATRSVTPSATATPGNTATATSTKPSATATSVSPSASATSVIPSPTATPSVTATSATPSATAASATPPATATLATPSATAVLATPLATATATSATPTSCSGDCDGDGVVTVDELVTRVGAKLNLQEAAMCPGLDSVSVLVAVEEVLAGCAPIFEPTETASPTATALPATATPTASVAPATATSTASPTATAAAVTATRTASPTATAAPATATRTATESPTRTVAAATATSTVAPATSSPTRSPTATMTMPPTGTPTSPASSGSPTASPTTVSAATLSSIQATIFDTKCASIGCHSGSFPANGLNLEAGKSYAQLVGAASFNFSAQQAGLLRVKPGDPDNSFLLIKLTLTAPSLYGSPMPSGQPLLSAAQVQLVRDWITQGAPNN